MSEKHFDVNEAREAVKAWDAARAGTITETITGAKVAVRLSKAIDEIERLRVENETLVARIDRMRQEPDPIEALKARLDGFISAINQRVSCLELIVVGVREKERVY